MATAVDEHPTRRGGGGAAAHAGRRGAPCGPSAAARSSWGRAGEPSAVELETGGLDRDPRAQRRRLHGGARGRRAARARRRRRSPPTGQMLALDPPLGAGDAATIGGDRRDRRLRPAAPPLRRRARPRGRHRPSCCPTARRQGRRQGDQERRRLRPRQAVRRLVRDARADRDGRRAPAPAAGRHRDRVRRAATTRTRWPRAAAALAALPARGRLPRRRLGAAARGRLLVRFGGAAAERQARGGDRMREAGLEASSDRRRRRALGRASASRQRWPTARC